MRLRTFGFLIAALSSAPLFALFSSQVTVVHPPPASVALGSVVSMTFSVTHHEETAMAIQYLIDLPVGSTIETPPNCAPGTRPVQCTTSRIDPGMPFFQTIHITAPSTEGGFAVRVTAPPNTASFFSSAVAQPDLAVRWDQSFLPRVDPGATLQASGTLANLAPLTAAHDVRLHLTASNGNVLAARLNGQDCLVAFGAAMCRLASLSQQSLPFTVTIETDGGTGSRQLVLNASATSDVADVDLTNNAALVRAQVNQLLVVTNTADSGPGSLRDAIEGANRDGCEQLCRIVFAIDEPLPPTGWYTIEPRTPLPELIASRAIIDATTLPDTNPNGPEVLLDGRELASPGDGLRIFTPCEGGVQGIAAGNFVYGIVAKGGTACGTMINVTRNDLGVAPDGTTPLPNLRGIGILGGFATIADNLVRANQRSGVWVDGGATYIQKNRIEWNGASGVYCGPSFGCTVTQNLIAQNREMGVAVVIGPQANGLPSAGADIRQNAMIGNGGLGIDIGLDGVTPPHADDSGIASNPPVILSARYDAIKDETALEFRVDTRPLGPYANAYLLDVYANDSADGDGERFLFEQTIQPSTQFVRTVKGDLTGQWINATSTRVHFVAKVAQPNSYAGGDAWTSELSAAVQVTR